MKATAVTPLRSTNITSEIQTVTPDMARTWLKNNTNNHPVSARRVQLIAKGKWCVTHQGIAFGPNGELYDGQHRLLAIVMANVPVPVLVTRGVS
jgi:hypothetical protein